MAQFKNLVLNSLSVSDLEALRPFLKRVDLSSKDVLYEAGGKIFEAYFPETAIISLVVGLATGKTIEAAMVGKDGVAGAASSLEGQVSLSRAVVQLAGTAHSISSNKLKAVAYQSPSLMSILIRHEQTLFAQAQQSTACIATHNIESRLCRWLLRARDLAETDTLGFTQEFLADMLGVERTSVTVAAHMLQQAGMIKYSRGRIQILDTQALQDTSCECYEAVKMHHAELLLGKTA